MSDPTGTAIHPLDRQGGETVLVVDDRREIADMAAEILEDSGYAAHVVYGAADALTIIGSGAPIDLLFTDMIMPGAFNGVTLALEAREHRPALKVLITTGDADGSRELAEGDGARFEVLMKPYKRGELLDKVRRALDRPSDTA